MDPRVSDLRKHIGFWMRLVSNNVSHAFARKLEASGVTVAEWVILREMYEHEGTLAPCQVAEITGLTRGAISKLMGRVLAKRLVERRDSVVDRRYQELALSQEGRALVPGLAQLADQNDAEFFSVLTKAEKRTLIDLLKKTATANDLVKVPIE